MAKNYIGTLVKSAFAFEKMNCSEEEKEQMVRDSFDIIKMATRFGLTEEETLERLEYEKPGEWRISFVGLNLGAKKFLQEMKKFRKQGNKEN